MVGGTALKPSFEPIIMARKPLKGTCIENVMKYEVGGINIDECRVTFSGNNGRFPANTILTYDETDKSEVIGNFPNTRSGKNGIRQSDGFNKNDYGKGIGIKAGMNNGEYGDSGSAARYFYCAKASKKDRDEGLEDFEDRIGGGMTGTQTQSLLTGSGNIRNNLRKNIHPTVKPTELMQYLIRLVTPAKGVILDPFNGSGSTGKAAMYENLENDKNYKYIGIELSKDYLEISKARIDYVLKKK